MTEEKAAFMAAVVDNPSIIGEADSYPQAEEAVFLLCVETPDINFVEVLDNTHFGGLLLEIVAMRLRGTKHWRRFVDTLAEADRTLWSTVRDSISSPFSTHHLERTLAQCAEPRELFRYLLARHPTVCTNHPIGKILERSADIFWQAEFFRRVLRNDSRRAWETINNACFGLRLNQQKILVASHDVIVVMVKELHQRMRNRKLVPEINDKADYSSVQAYDNKMPARGRHGHQRRPKVSQSRSIPGMKVASYIREHDTLSMSEVNALKKMALAMGHYFARKRNEKRARKYVQLLREFEKKEES